MEARLDYKNKMILAPMVKVGTLPMRLLALEYGADIVYTEEIIDKRILASERSENSVLGTIDYIDKRDNSLVFRTCAKEKDKLVIQIGTSDPARAAVVGQRVERDVSGLDVNMGCPKSFSLKGGMGAALLSQPDKVRDILTRLVESVKIPVTAKIRLLPDYEDTLNLVDVIQDTGVAALAVHGRTKDQRQGHKNDVETIKKISEHARIPIIANGGSSNNRSSETNTFEGITQFWKESGASSVMVARAAEWNPSVFREGPRDDVLLMIDKYLGYAIEYDYPFNIAKYCVQQLLGSLQTSKPELGRKFLDSATMEDLCAVFGLGDKYLERQRELSMKERSDGKFVEKMNKTGREERRKRKIDDLEVTEMFYPFVRGHYGGNESSRLPKTLLLQYCRQSGLEQPEYCVEQQDKQFRGRVTVGTDHYANTSWEKNKKFAEQGAALVAVTCLEITSDTIIWRQDRLDRQDRNTESNNATIKDKSDNGSS